MGSEIKQVLFDRHPANSNLMLTLHSESVIRVWDYRSFAAPLYTFEGGIPDQQIKKIDLDYEYGRFCMV
jgi:WD40 repeat protein